MVNFVLNLLHSREYISLGDKTCRSHNRCGHVVVRLHVNAVQLGVTGNSNHHLVGLTGPYITLKDTRISTVASVPLAIVEHNLGNHLVGRNLEGQRTAIDAQLGTVVGTPEAVGSA